jgi:hypothetical protein
MARHMKELVDAGLCHRNNTSRWTSPPLIVKKPGVGQSRMTVNVRAVNAQTEIIQWSMPMLEVILDHLNGASVFFSIDFSKGYWQLSLHRNSQELFLIATDMGGLDPNPCVGGWQ